MTDPHSNLEQLPSSNIFGFRRLPSLKLTAKKQPKKWMVGKRILPYRDSSSSFQMLRYAKSKLLSGRIH